MKCQITKHLVSYQLKAYLCKDLKYCVNTEFDNLVIFSRGIICGINRLKTCNILTQGRIQIRFFILRGY